MYYYKPDARWDLYVKTRKEFVKQFVVIGKFHDKVPEGIVKSFETVSYLLAHSYYHWPMFDEAMSKVLLIMEMAIKIKASELDISTQKTTKNNRKSKKRLVDIINDVFKVKELMFLKPDFDRARNFRNIKMHPDKHSFMGALSLAHANAHLFVNVINLLFLEKTILENITTNQKKLEQQLIVFKNKLFVLEFNDTKILIVDVHTLKYVESSNNKLLMLYINPVFTKVHEVFVEKKYPDPLVITLKNFNINQDRIEGIDIKNKHVNIYPTEKLENIIKWRKYIEDLNLVSNEDIDIYIKFNSSPALWNMERVIYENCWV